MNRDELITQISEYCPCNEQEQADKKNILAFLSENDNAFLRENELAHMTASAWVVNHNRTKVLMVYHKIYDSWSWTGGHADGETDLLSVALREVTEETGIRHADRNHDRNSGAAAHHDQQSRSREACRGESRAYPADG